MPLNRPRNPARGFTLIELLVAVAVLALASTAALGVFDAARRGIGGAEARLLAREAAENHAALLRLSPAVAPPATARMGTLTWDVTTLTRTTASGLTEATITLRRADAPGAERVVILPRPRDGGQP